jgi:methylated-DNA-[protein]-cysteine S-methyltransferase
MSPAARNTHVFETAMGFCGIAWSGEGVARFQLPTKSAEATERLMRRRVPGAEPGATPEDIAAVVAAARRYFNGEKTDFSQVRLDLGDEDAFFRRIYQALRLVGWGGTTTYGALAKEVGAGREAARDVGEAMARNPVPLIIPATGFWPPAARSAASPRPAARRRRLACSNWRAFAFSPPRRRNTRSTSERSEGGPLSGARNPMRPRSRRAIVQKSGRRPVEGMFSARGFDI